MASPGIGRRGAAGEQGSRPLFRVPGGCFGDSNRSPAGSLSEIHEEDNIETWEI